MKKTRLKLRNAVQGAGRFNCGWNTGKSLVPCGLRVARLIPGETITFPVEFVKENGLWKIIEF